MVFQWDLTTNVFHEFAEYLYGNNMVEQENWQPGQYFLSSLNFGGLQDSAAFQVIFFSQIYLFPINTFLGHFLK